MMIPNKFNGYMSDGRRLYPDPATSVIFAKALATAGGTAAAAVPAATTALAAAAPVATTAAANLGTTAALEASKQGIIQAGAQQAGVEAAKQAGIEATKQAAGQGAQQAGTETLKQGIMQGADDAAAMNLNQVNALNPAQTVTEQSIQNGLNNVNNLSANLNPSGVRTASDAGTLQGGSGNILPSKTQTMDQYLSKMAEGPSPYELTGKTPDFLANAPSPTNADLYGNAAQGLDKASYNVADAAKSVPKDVVGNPNLKMPNMPELTTAKAPPNALERGFNAATQFAKDHPYITTAGIMAAQSMSQPSYNQPAKKKYSGSGGGGGDFKYNEPSTGEYTPIFEPTPYAVGGPVEQMSAENAIGGNMMYPQSQMDTPMYSNPMMSRPVPTNVINTGVDAPTNTYATGGKVSAFEKMMKEEEARKKQADAQARSDLEQDAKSQVGRTRPYSRTQSTNTPYAAAVKELQALSKKYGIKTVAPAKTNVDLMGDQDQIEYAANGGIMHGLGGYSDGGRLLKGPGDGVSDSIPAVIGNKQPARLADGEFVIPARIVSELGNGSTEAGARKLYAMMERVQKRRGKTVGKGKVAVNSKADKHLPA